MDWSAHYSGANVPPWDHHRPSPVVLRLLPHLHLPPARVIVPQPPGAGESQEAAALRARGYDAQERALAALLDAPAAASGAQERADIWCEHLCFSALSPTARDAYVAAAAHALRPGGQLFGAFLNAQPSDAGEILSRFSPYFEVSVLEPSAFLLASAGLPQLEVVLVRR